jgi:hypothetical protein
MMTVAMPILETMTTKLVFALRLRDRLTLEDALAGDVAVTAGPRAGMRKPGTGTFIFLDLPAGPVVCSMRSADDTPFYRPADIPIVIPSGSALWPAYPDNGLADPALPLSSPAQPAAFRAQFLACALLPDVAYPFDPAASLARGVVSHAGAGVANASVFDVAGDALPFVTGPTGEFVLVFTNPPPTTAVVTIRTQRQGQRDVDTAVTIRRGATAAVAINV